MLGRRQRDRPLDLLSPRERDVLGAMAEGKSGHGIAQALLVSQAAVEKHVTSIFHKLQLDPAATEHRRVLCSPICVTRRAPSARPVPHLEFSEAGANSARRGSNASARARMSASWIAIASTQPISAVRVAGSRSSIATIRRLRSRHSDIAHGRLGTGSGS
jgi:DNA-binding CsgD family transcriptional regulator